MAAQHRISGCLGHRSGVALASIGGGLSSGGSRG